MPADPNKMVEVTVAARRSIHTRELGQRQIIHGPGKKVMVPETDLARLLKQGFIVDPHSKKLTPEEIAAADASAYLPKEGAVKFEEEAPQSIRSGKAARTAA